MRHIICKHIVDSITFEILEINISWKGLTIRFRYKACNFTTEPISLDSFTYASLKKRAILDNVLATILVVLLSELLKSNTDCEVNGLQGIITVDVFSKQINLL